MSHAYNLGVQHALMKLGAEELAPQEPSTRPEPGFWERHLLSKELRPNLSEQLLEPIPGVLKSVGGGMLGGAALGGIAGLPYGKAGPGAFLGAIGGTYAGGISKGIGNFGTNYTHGKTVEDLDKRLKANPSEEERAQILQEFDSAKGLRKQKLDKPFW